MSQAATTVLPNAVVAARTPMSCRNSASAAFAVRAAMCHRKDTFKGSPRKSFIAENRLNLERPKRFHYFIQATSRKGEMLRMVLGASNNSRFVVSRQAHGLRAIELRILKRGQTQQSVAQAGRKVFFADVDLVAED